MEVKAVRWGQGDARGSQVDETIGCLYSDTECGPGPPLFARLQYEVPTLLPFHKLGISQLLLPGQHSQTKSKPQAGRGAALELVPSGARAVSLRKCHGCADVQYLVDKISEL